MTIEQAIQKAIENGYEPKYDFVTEFPSQIVFADDGSICLTGEGGKVLGVYDKEKMLLDKDFWQCLGKDLWNGKHNFSKVGKKYDWAYKCKLCGAKFGGKKYFVNDECRSNTWLFHWHRFIDHLAEGGTIEKFFEELK